MRIEHIEPVGEVDPKDDTVAEGSIDCPKCGLVWMRASDGIDEETKCPHLRFVIGPHEMEYCFNGMTAEALIASVARAYQLVNREAQELTPEEAYSEAQVDYDFWAAATMDEIDSIFKHTEHGVACGPVGFTVLYGAKMDA